MAALGRGNFFGTLEQRHFFVALQTRLEFGFGSRTDAERGHIGGHFFDGDEIAFVARQREAVFVQFPFQGNGFGRVELLVEAVCGDGRKTSKSKSVFGS